MIRVTQQPQRALTQLGPGPPTEIIGEAPRPQLPAAFDYRQEPPLIPGYEIMRLIDHGGMSNIYLARQIGLDRQVAIKMIRPEDSLDRHVHQRFVLEASSIASLQHPNIVQIFEIGEAHGLPFLCLEFIEGGNLERRIRKQRPTPQEAAEIVRQLAEGIQAAHDHQIIHRDLKPANILWTERACPTGPASDSTDPSLPAFNFTVKITDFGLARILCDRSDQTKSGYAIGTPSFMSPEQASGHPGAVGMPTDIYGLGAILYELLTGEPPFHGPTTLDTIHAVRFEAPTPPSRLDPRVPRDLECICLQCLEKQPENRYRSARDLALDLRRYLQGKSVSAHRLGPIRRMWRLGRRNRLGLLTYVSLVALTSAAAIGALGLNQAADSPARQLSKHAPNAAGAPEVVDVDVPASSRLQKFLQRVHQEPTRAENASEIAELGAERMASLAEDYPHDFAVQFGIGGAYLLRHDLERAAVAFEAARQAAEEQTRQMDGGTEAWANLASAHERLGDIHAQKHDRKSAMVDFERTIGVREMLAQDDPREPRWALELAWVCQKQAENYVDAKELFTAVLLYDRRVGLLTRLLADDPSLAPAVRATHERMAELHRQLGHVEAAEFHLKAAKAIPDYSTPDCSRS
jgi:serine/threonine protein kinase